MSASILICHCPGDGRMRSSLHYDPCLSIMFRRICSIPVSVLEIQTPPLRNLVEKFGIMTKAKTSACSARHLCHHLRGMYGTETGAAATTARSRGSGVNRHTAATCMIRRVSITTTRTSLCLALLSPACVEVVNDHRLNATAKNGVRMRSNRAHLWEGADTCITRFRRRRAR